MSKYELSIIIPARNEEFLSRTVDSILENKSDKTEIIIGLDDYWPDPPLKPHKDITVIHVGKSIGQRALSNKLVKSSQGKVIMKLDAHCIVSKGFDSALLEGYKKLGSNVVQVPIMYNLHAFDWLCQKVSCGNRTYQGPKPEKCEKCGGSEFIRDIVWKPRFNRKSEFYRFNTEPHFQYHGDRKKQVSQNEEYPESMSVQGSCFVVSREMYDKWNICDEAIGSWGSQGIEIACKAWLSGGRVVINRNCWYAHLFRTQKDFSFPYPQSQKKIEQAKKIVRELFFNNAWDQQIRPLSWLIDKFKPLPGWHTGTDKEKHDVETLEYVNMQGLEFYKHKGVKMQNQPQNIDVKVLNLKSHSKSILFYTDNTLNLKLAHKVQKQLLKANLPIISVSLKPMTFGQNIHLTEKRGYLTMAKQILAGLEASTADIIFFCEHDVLYHPSHFDFTPSRTDVYYYNTNVWRVRKEDGHALYCDNLQQLSGLCAYRETLLEHYRKRIKLLEEHIEYCISGEDFNRFVRSMGFEPGTHGRPERVDDLKAGSYQSLYPNIDIRHESNLTPSRWSKEQFRNERYTKGWAESHISQLQGWNLQSI